MSLSNQKNDLKQGCWYCAIFTMAMKLLMKNRNCHCHQIGNIKKNQNFGVIDKFFTWNVSVTIMFSAG
jgi:hypothetical protein